MGLVIRMPEVLTGATEAALQSWLVSVGDEVAVGQPLAEVETEKATVEYEAEAGGVVARLLIETGVQVSVGTPIAVLAKGGESAADALASVVGEIGDGEPGDGELGGAGSQPTAAAEAEAPAPSVAASAATAGSESEPSESVAATTPAAPESPGSGERVFMSPLVRRLAAERGLELSGVTGSGPGGRIVRRDLDALASKAPQAPSTAQERIETTAAGFTDIPHTGMRRAIARRLTESVTTVPQFYLVSDCRVDAMLELRRQITEQAGFKPSVNDFVLKAVAAALIEVPEANAIWTDDAVRRFGGVDLGIAVAIDNGLLTPVLRGVDRLSLREISERVAELATRARSGGIKQNELEGGSFAVSNLGGYGTTEFTAIINPPHSGILAVGAARKLPVVEGDELTVGSVLTVTLSADHRVLDGALAAQWLAAFQNRIENPLSLLV